ncbi:MAG: hypothetical protein AAFQ07_07335 [Chloroflexota bacterium]
MPFLRVVRLLFLILCLMILSLVSAQEIPDLDATYDDDDETFVFDYPSHWELSESADGYGVDLVGVVDDVTVSLSIESVPPDLLTESLDDEEATIFDTWATAYALEDYDYIVLDDRDAIIGTVGTDSNPITVIIIETYYTPFLYRYAVIFAVIDAPEGDETAQDTILAIASTVIERDAEPVLVAPAGLGGIISGNSESEAPQNTLRNLTGDEPDTDDNDDNDDDDDDEA